MKGCTELMMLIKNLILTAAVAKTDLDPEDIVVEFKVQYIEDNDEPILLIVEERESCIQFRQYGDQLETTLEAVYQEAQSLKSRKLNLVRA